MELGNPSERQTKETESVYPSSPKEKIIEVQCSTIGTALHPHSTETAKKSPHVESRHKEFYTGSKTLHHKQYYYNVKFKSSHLFSYHNFVKYLVPKLVIILLTFVYIFVYRQTVH